MPKFTLNLFVLAVLWLIIFISDSEWSMKIIMAVFVSLFFIPAIRKGMLIRCIAVIIACPTTTLAFFAFSAIFTNHNALWGEVLIVLWFTFLIYLFIGIPYSLIVDKAASLFKLGHTGEYWIRFGLYGLAAILMALPPQGLQGKLMPALYVYSYFHILYFLERKQRSGS